MKVIVYRQSTQWLLSLDNGEILPLSYAIKTKKLVRQYVAERWGYAVKVVFAK